MNQFGSLLKRRLLSKELSIPAKKCKNKGVQTYSKEKQFALKSCVQDRSPSTHGSISSNCAKNPFRFSPPQYNINGSATLDEIIEKQDMLFTPKSNIILHHPKRNQRSSWIRSYIIDPHLILQQVRKILASNTQGHL